MSEAQVTSAAWGGKYLDELYVTTAAFALVAPQSEVAGQLFRIRGLSERGLNGTKTPS